MTLRPCAGNRWIRDHLTEVTSSCPSVIVLHINLGSLPASEVVGEILQIARDLRRDYQCPVYVTTPGLAASFTREFTGRRRDQHRTASHLAFWRHLGCGLNSCYPDMFQGVHLSPSGMEKYYQNIRTCVSRAIRHQ